MVIKSKHKLQRELPTVEETTRDMEQTSTKTHFKEPPQAEEVLE